jgi:hypothetical protein
MAPALATFETLCKEVGNRESRIVSMDVPKHCHFCFVFVFKSQLSILAENFRGLPELPHANERIVDTLK